MELSQIKMLNNYALIKPQGTYDKVTLGSGVQLHVGYNHSDRGKHVSILGTLLRLPKSLVFSKDILSTTSDKSERVSMVDASMPWECENLLQEGDFIIYDYLQNIAAELEHRWIEVDGHGICLFIHYSTIFGYSRQSIDEGYKPINGNIFFLRDRAKASEKKSGLEIIHNVGDYELNTGKVVSADGPVKRYLHPGNEDFGLVLNDDDRVVVKPGHGFRIAYDIHAPEGMKGIEIIRRPQLLAKLS